jgi:hypothetical protein
MTCKSTCSSTISPRCLPSPQPTREVSQPNQNTSWVGSACVTPNQKANSTMNSYGDSKHAKALAAGPHQVLPYHHSIMSTRRNSVSDLQGPAALLKPPRKLQERHSFSISTAALCSPQTTSQFEIAQHPDTSLVIPTRDAERVRKGLNITESGHRAESILKTCTNSVALLGDGQLRGERSLWHLPTAADPSYASRDIQATGSMQRGSSASILSTAALASRNEMIEQNEAKPTNFAARSCHKLVRALSSNALPRRMKSCNLKLKSWKGQSYKAQEETSQIS